MQASCVHSGITRSNGLRIGYVLSCSQIKTHKHDRMRLLVGLRDVGNQFCAVLGRRGGYVSVSWHVVSRRVVSDNK